MKEKSSTTGLTSQFKTGQQETKSLVSKQDTFGLQRMYNQEEIGNFSSSDTRLKQLIMKVKDQEKINSDLKIQVKQAKTDVVVKQKEINKKMATEVNKNIEGIYKDI